MPRRFVAAIIGLSATVGLLLGLLVAGSLTPAPAVSAPASRPRLAGSRTTNARVAEPAVISFADIAERLNPAVVNIDASSHGMARRAPLIPGLPDGPEPFEHPERPQSGRDTSWDRHRVLHRSGGTPSHQQSRGGRGRPGDRAPGEWHEPSRAANRRRSRHRHRTSEGGLDSAAAVCATRGFRPFARGGVGGGHRQPAGVRAHGHSRRRELHRAEAVQLLARPLHPDGCRDQLRQQRRTADRRARRGGRHQRRHQLACSEHRLCRADQPGNGHPAAVAGKGPRHARLHRYRPARTSIPTSSVRCACARRRRARAGRQRWIPWGPGGDPRLRRHRGGRWQSRHRQRSADRHHRRPSSQGRSPRCRWCGMVVL